MKPFFALCLKVCAGVTLWSAGLALATAQDELSALQLRGKTLYADSCADCHGEIGEGVEGAYETALTGDDSIGQLTQTIVDTMPEGSPEDCVGEDAEAIAEYMHYAFYSEAAQIRRRPPRVTLARLTAGQLRQSLSDLYASFGGLPPTPSEFGLKGEYYSGKKMSKENRKLARVDAVIDFDFGNESPGEDIDAEEYSIRWNGGLWVRESGRYELILRTTCSSMFYFGRSDKEFINNHVQSGDKTEFRESVYLTAGRVYPMRIEFLQRKRKTEQPPAKISLSWVPPGLDEELIPNSALVTGWVPAAYSLQTDLPPDDRSYGYERGIAVNKEWDDSTTLAALEFANACREELWPHFQRENRKKLKEGRSALEAFLTQLVETAFRSELNDSEKEFYIDRHLEAEPDDGEAIKRVCLVSLKSPRFLFPTADGDQSKSQKVANRIALTLFDSLPVDGWLRPDALKGEFETEGLARAYAEKYVDDPRVQAKTRELLHAWLNLEHLADLTKDDDLYPGFDEALQADLKQSLNTFLDHVVWSDRSDFRELFTADYAFTTSRIGEFYGGPWKTEAEGLVRTEPSSEIHGIVNHPLLMSGLAYHDATSPIHRGVFLIRYMLGRLIRPPAEAFSPLSPDLHPDLTTRERVSLQTSPESCQVCHSKINGIGFCLENYDAVGKFREMDREKAVDATGEYVARDGQQVEFSGPSDLADYLANSEDAHRAFVSRAFQHFVKQPPAAFGADTLDRLTAKFEADGCSIRKLLVEIAVTSVQPTLQEQTDAEIHSVSQN